MNLSRRSSVLSMAPMSTTTLQSQQRSATPLSFATTQAVGESSTAALSFTTLIQTPCDGDGANQEKDTPDA
jgi:hypothetical protein